MTLIEAVQRYAGELPESVALIHGKQTIRWRDLLSKVQHYQAALEKIAGHRITIYFEQNIDSVALLIASSTVNKQSILVSSYYDMVTAQNFMQSFSAAPLIKAQDGKLVVLAEGVAADVMPPSQPSICLLTSGTTGTPKCVERPWAGLIAAVKVDPQYQQKHWLQCYPITHFAGMQNFLRCYLNGGSLVIPVDFKPLTASQNIHQYQIDFLNCTPTYMRQLLTLGQHNLLASLKHISLGGEIAQQSLLDAMKKAVPSAKITHIYGSSELGMILMVRDGLEGFPSELIDNKRLKIIDDELFVKPDQYAMRGYLDKTTIGAEEWVGTKDLVKIENERCLFLGRRDDVINVGGYKVNPQVIENVIRELPEILDVAVMGQENALVGNIIKAIICVSPDTDCASTEANITQHCKKTLPNHMVPRLFEFSHQLNVTETQKLLRRTA